MQDSMENQANVCAALIAVSLRSGKVIS